MGSVGSGNGSGGSSGGSGEDTRNAIGINNQVGEGETGSSDIDPSSSEQSCDTVIYLGPSIDEATDGEHPPVYLPSLETTPGENEAKIIPSKCPLLNGPNGVPPKTKSPKPKSSSKLTSDSNFSSQNGKSEEQWVDGPKVAKYRQVNGNNSSGGVASNNSVQNCAPSPAKKKGETWIDGPAARVQHQASNFPSPKKTNSLARNGAGLRSNGNNHNSSSNGRATCDLANCPAVCINATKAEMIQKWISNQTPAATDLFEESPIHNAILESFYNGQHETGNVSNGALNNLPLSITQPQYPQALNGQQISSCAKGHSNSDFANIYSCHCLNRESNFAGPAQLHTEPEYKALTVFKTCDDVSIEDDHQSLCNGYDFEFIEVVEPEVPVPTRDAWLQVTEEDIALAYLEENPLPESDQNYEMSPESYFSRARSSSFSEISSCTSHNSLPKLEKADDHPLRVLSQECLTVVSTFADSMSISGGDMERFWPRLSFPSDLETSQDIGMCHGLCKTLTGQGPKVSPPSNNTHTLSSKLEQMSTQNNKPPSSLLLRELPVLSDDSIFKVPIIVQQPQKSAKLSRLSAINSRKYVSGKESSDTDGESMKIPPMDLIDTTPITSSCNLESATSQVQPITVSLPLRSTQEQPMEFSTPSPPRPMCEHNHSLQDIQHHSHGLLLSSVGSGGSVQSSPSRSTLTPPSSTSPVTPIKMPDVTKSPSKSKSRKISKFFRTRSKSPKTAGATSSSESGKSSMSSDAKHSSSSSSCSSGVSATPVVINSKQKSHSSPKHMSPSRHQSPSKKQSSRKNSCFSTTSSTDYHFTCDSVLPMFLPPNPNQNKKIGSVDMSGNGVLITDLGLVKSK